MCRLLLRLMILCVLKKQEQQDFQQQEILFSYCSVCCLKIRLLICLFMHKTVSQIAESEMKLENKPLLGWC